jgi:hypothetical protein
VQMNRKSGDLPGPFEIFLRREGGGEDRIFMSGSPSNH